MGAPYFSGVWWVVLALGVRPCWSLVPPCQVSIKNTNMEVQSKEGPQYPANEGAKISGDRPRNLVMQGVAVGMATCDPAQGVQAQGTLGSEATCATTSSESLPR